MPRFIDEDRGHHHHERDGGVSPEAYQNDYRNRMPFHYIDEGNVDGYYYWQFGQTMNIEFELENEFSFSDGEDSNEYAPISDFFKGSPTRRILMRLDDFRGNEIYRQEVLAKDMVFCEDTVKFYLNISEDLSAILIPNQYKLFINIIDVSPEIPEDQGDESELAEGVERLPAGKIIYNKSLTEQGIIIRIRD